MTYDNELILISETYTEDEIGNQIPIEKRTNILCNISSIGRNEFYNAANSGLKPSLIFTIHTYEYNNESLVEFENVRYKVIKTYSKGIEEVELTCEKVLGSG